MVTICISLEWGGPFFCLFVFEGTPKPFLFLHILNYPLVAKLMKFLIARSSLPVRLTGPRDQIISRRVKGSEPEC